VDENGKVVYGEVGYDVLLQMQLARYLGIPSEQKEVGTASDGTGN